MKKPTPQVRPGASKPSKAVNKPEKWNPVEQELLLATEAFLLHRRKAQERSGNASDGYFDLFVECVGRAHARQKLDIPPCDWLSKEQVDAIDREIVALAFRAGCRRPLFCEALDVLEAEYMRQIPNAELIRRIKRADIDEIQEALQSALEICERTGKIE